MNQFRTSTFLFALATLTGILCASAADAQIDAAAPAAQRQSFPIPSSDSQPISITLGPDGNFWFTEQDRSQMARITPDGVITEFLTPTFSFPIDITAGPDGNIWFAEGAAGSGGQIAFITPDGQIEEIVFSTSTAAASGIVTGPDGNIWFTQRFGLQLGKVTPTGQFTFYPIPNPAEQITRGPGNTLLFTEFGSDKIAKITTNGVVTESPEFRGSGPTGIVAGPSREIWFLGYASNRVYKVTFRQ